MTASRQKRKQPRCRWAHMCVRRLCRHRVVVIDGLKEITHELKGIGRSINQLVVLCNMGRIKEVHLDDAWQTLSQVYLKLRELAEQERT